VARHNSQRCEGFRHARLDFDELLKKSPAAGIVLNLPVPPMIVADSTPVRRAVFPHVAEGLRYSGASKGEHRLGKDDMG
jgi:hypothetical protein